MIRRLALVAAALALAGCRVDLKDPKYPHDGRPAAEQDHSARPADTKGSYYGLDLNALYERANKSGVDRAKEIVEPLAAILLDESKLSDAHFRGHRQTTWAVGFFNSQLLRARTEKLEVSKVFERYREQLLRGCDFRELTGCRHLAFFSRDPHVSSVLKVFARETRDIETYFRLLALAYEVKSVPADPELDEMVYARVVEFLKIYVHAAPKGDSVTLALKNMSEARRAEFLFFRRFLATALKSRSDRPLSGPQAVELYDWISSQQLEVVLGRELATVISTLVASQIEQPEMWSRFIRQFNIEQRDQELSYSNALSRVNDTDPNLLKRLGVKTFDLKAAVDSRSTETAAIMYLSRIFDLRPPTRDRYLWDLAKVEPARAMELIEAYVYVTLVDRALDTHRRMAKFYREKMQGQAKTELLRDAMKYSDINVTPIWKDYVTRVQQLELFFAENIERPLQNERGTPLADDVKRVRRTFEELNPAIKYFVTYPNMIMLGYFAAKVNLQFTIQTFFGSKLEINKDLVLHDLMEGNMGPMFLFTSYRAAESRLNATSIDSVQMLWSLYFAMTTDLPGMYGIPAREFLSTFITAYKSRTDTQLRKMIKFQEDLLRPNSDIQRLLGICDAGPLARGMFDHQMDLHHLRYTAFMGEVGQSTRPPLTAAMTLVNFAGKSGGNSLDEALEILRSDVDPKLRRLFLIKAAFKEARSTDAAALAHVDTLLEETLELRQRLLNQTRELITRLPSCMLQMRDIENRRRHEALAMERRFLGYVQTALEAFNGARDEGAALRALQARGGFFAGLDVNKSAVDALNALMNERVGMERAFTSIAEYRADYRRAGGFQRDTSGRLYFNYRGRDLLVRTASFLMNGFDGLDLSDRPDRLNISLPINLKEMQSKLNFQKGADEFPLYYMSGDTMSRAALAQYRLAIRWFGDLMGASSVFRHFLRFESALLKFDALGDLDLERTCDASCHARRNREIEKRMESLLVFSRGLLDRTRLFEADIEVVRAFETQSYYSFDGNGGIYHNGPKELFQADNIAQDILGIGDEVFTYLTSIRLGYDPQFRDLRPIAEKSLKIEQSDTGQDFASSRVVKADELISRTDPYRKATRYYVTLRDKAELRVFDISPEIDRQIDLFHTIQIGTDLRLAEQFVDTASRWVQANPLPEVQFSLINPPRRPPSISTSLMGNYFNQIRHFHDQTSNVFKDITPSAAQ